MTELHKQYLGDAVYASWNGWALVLTTEDGISTSNEITFDEHTLAALDRYRVWLRERLADDLLAAPRYALGQRCYRELAEAAQEAECQHVRTGGPHTVVSLVSGETVYTSRGPVE